MRMIFILLLLGNIAFLASQLWAPAPAPDLVAAVSAQQNFGNLQTLAERDLKNKGQAKLKRAPLESSSAASSSAADKCQLVGPFAELLHAEYLVEHLHGLDVAATIKHVEIADGKNYWVYLKPEMSEKEALRRLYEIQAKAIDSYIIPSGELANGISFGQFGDPKEAADKSEQIRAQGYAAEVKEIPKSHSETWVEVYEQGGQKVSEERWLELLKEEKSIERRQNFCLGVAH